MSEEKQGKLPLDQGLLGMQGFSAARAERYRAEISKLLTGQISTFDRWALAVSGVMFLITLGLLPVLGIYNAPVFEGILGNSSASVFRGFEETRLTLAVTFMATGALLCAWLLWIAIRGNYGRRTGDLMAATIAGIFCGGSGVAFIEVAWVTDDPVLRMKMFFSGALFFAIVFGCLLFTLLARMHRQLNQRLLRIDYHVAELMARGLE